MTRDAELGADSYPDPALRGDLGRQTLIELGGNPAPFDRDGIPKDESQLAGTWPLKNGEEEDGAE